MIKEFKYEYDDEHIFFKICVPDNSDKVYPAVIMAHGFCVNHAYFENYAEELLKQDIVSVLFDFRSGFELSSSSGNFYTTSVVTEINDLNLALKKVQDFAFVDVNNIYLLGHSQGAFVSSIVAAYNPSLIKSLFLLAPAFLIPEEMMRTKLPSENELKDNAVGVISRKYVLDARGINIYSIIGNYKKPVYIYHGSNDKAVPIEYSKKAAEIYENAKLKILSNQRHNFKKIAQMEVINDLITIIKGE